MTFSFIYQQSSLTGTDDTAEKIKRGVLKMAKNWKASEAVLLIQEGNKEAILDCGRRFPMFTNAVAKGNYEGLVAVIAALPDYISARKIETVLKDGVGAVEDDAEVEDEEEVEEVKPAKKAAKKGKKKPAPEPEEEEEELDEEDDEEEEVVVKKSSKKKKAAEKPATKKKGKAKKKAAPVEDDDEDEDDDWDI